MTNSQFTSTPTPRRKRPLSVTLLAWVVLIMALWGWLRLIEVLRQWQYLQTLTPAPPVLYLALTGLIWGLIGSALVWGLILGRAWTPRWMRAAAVIYTLYYWIDRLWIAQPNAIASRWPFALGLNIILLALSFGVFLRPQVQQFFQPRQT